MLALWRHRICVAYASNNLALAWFAFFSNVGCVGSGAELACPSLQTLGRKVTQVTQWHSQRRIRFYWTPSNDGDVFSLHFFFWKNKTRLMRSTCCLSVCVPPLLFIGNKPSLLFIIQCVPGGEVNILGGHSIGHSKEKTVCIHVSYSERFPR
jgi:hypothetical protein